MMEQEEMIKDMKGRIATLEHDNKELKGALEKHEESSANEIKKVEAKIAKTNKSLDNLEATSKKEFKKINTARSQLT
jgi:predicted  nucleic acid-binding Zn-ribbon protein